VVREVLHYDGALLPCEAHNNASQRIAASRGVEHIKAT
jgi:hypothetical protein